MSVYKRNGKWSAYVSHKDKRIRRGGFETKEEAILAEQTIRASLVLGQSVETSSHEGTRVKELQTLGGLYNFVMSRYWSGKPSEDTNRINATDCIEILGHTRHPRTVAEIDLDHLISTFRGRKLSGATINRKLAALRRMLRVAFDRTIIPRMPKFELVSEREHRIRFWSAEEQQKIENYFAFVGDDLMLDLFRVLTDTGVRLGTALKITWKANIDLASVPPKLIVHGDQDKTNHSRSIPLTTRLVQVLDERRERQQHNSKPKASDRVFAITKDAVEHRWRQCRIAVGMEHDKQAVLHTCRHTFCSRLSQCGVPVPVIKELAGHRNIKTTMRYVHLAPSDHVSAVDQMERFARSTDQNTG